MAKTVYFDTNVFFDVFEGRDPALFPELQELVSTGLVDVVVSEINLAEALAGNHRPTFATGVNQLFGVTPRWISLSGLATREVAATWSGPHKPTVLVAPGALQAWGDLVPSIIEDAESIPDIFQPSADALLEAFPEGTVAERLTYWKSELKSLQGEFRDIMRYVATPQNVFRKLVATALRPNLGSTRDLADQLWENPDRAPAIRMKTEWDCHVLNVANPKWTTNDFLDHIHGGVLGHLDLFVTRDGLGKERGLIQKIEWYDREVRVPRGCAPYEEKLCRGWGEFTKRART